MPQMRGSLHCGGGGGGVQVPYSASEALADFTPLSNDFNALNKVESFGLASTVAIAVCTSGLAQVAIGASESPLAWAVAGNTSAADNNRAAIVLDIKVSKVDLLKKVVAPSKDFRKEKQFHSDESRKWAKQDHFSRYSAERD